MIFRPDIEPLSQEWRDWRRLAATASKACVIMGEPGYGAQTWEELRKPIVRKANPFLERAAERGVRLEDAGRALHGWSPPYCVERGLYLASLDSVNVPERRWREIKAPVYRERSKLYLAARSRDLDAIPRHVWWQLVHQSGVMGCSWTCILTVIVNDWLDVEEWTIPLHPLRRDWRRLDRGWRSFMRGETMLEYQLAESLA